MKLFRTLFNWLKRRYYQYYLQFQIWSRSSTRLRSAVCISHQSYLNQYVCDEKDLGGGCDNFSLSTEGHASSSFGSSCWSIQGSNLVRFYVSYVQNRRRPAGSIIPQMYHKFSNHPKDKDKQTIMKFQTLPVILSTFSVVTSAAVRSFPISHSPTCVIFEPIKMGGDATFVDTNNATGTGVLSTGKRSICPICRWCFF